MDLMELMLNAGGGGAIGQLAQQFGLSQDQAQSAVASLLPALKGGLSRNVKQEGGLDSLLQALAGGNHQQYFDDPSVLGSPEAIADGNGILGHLLGNKETSRAVAAQASAQTGIGTEILKKMLPMVASLLMGSLSNQSNQASAGPLSLGQQSGGLGFLTSLLDSNNDGSIGDDLLGMMGKFLSR